jgi:DNA-binding CsgD family transcriptional regulator
MGELLDDIEKAGQLGQTLNLAPREVEIAALMAEGDTATQIAEKLSVAEETVKTRQKHIRRKLGARNGVHAIVIAIREGVIE